MKPKLDNIFWGLILILGGVLALGQQQGWIDTFSIRFWMIGLGAVGLIFLIRYLVGGLREWGWLFPTLGFFAASGMLWLGDNGYADTWVVTPVFAAIILPFLVAFVINVRKNWWALIPAFSLTVTWLMIVFGDRLPEDVIGASFMFAIAIPFGIVYLVNRKNAWALIPAFTMAMIGCLVLLSSYNTRIIEAFIPLAIAAAFFYVYLRSPQNWWAFIPAGIMASSAVSDLLTDPALGKFGQSTFPTGVLFLGWAATFGFLWLKRDQHPTVWARIPAQICAIIAFILLVIGTFTEFGLVVVLLASGLLLIFLGLRPRGGAGSNSL
jgi:hypothetical protein